VSLVVDSLTTSSLVLGPRRNFWPGAPAARVVDRHRAAEALSQPGSKRRRATCHASSVKQRLAALRTYSRWSLGTSRKLLSETLSRRNCTAILSQPKASLRFNVNQMYASEHNSAAADDGHGQTGR
jgi:hypothetical protein